MNRGLDPISKDLSNPIRALFNIFTQHDDIKQNSNEVLTLINLQSTNALEHLHSSIGMLGKFLLTGAQDKELGILQEEDIVDMAWHIRSLGELCSQILAIKENASLELENRKNNWE